MRCWAMTSSPFFSNCSVLIGRVAGEHGVESQSCRNLLSKAIGFGRCIIISFCTTTPRLLIGGST